MIDTLVPPTIGNQEAVVVAAEGVNELGKGILQVSCQKEPMAGESTFRAPIDALEVVGFRCSDEVRWCRECMQIPQAVGQSQVTGFANLMRTLADSENSGTHISSLFKSLSRGGLFTVALCTHGAICQPDTA